MALYDLVKIAECDDEKFIGAVGIIKEVHHGHLFEIIFVGRELNALSNSYGRLLFTENELEGI